MHMKELENFSKQEVLMEFLEEFAEAFITLDVNWIVLYINTKGAGLFDRKREELIGKNILAEFPDRLSPEIKEKAKEALATQTMQSVTVFSRIMNKWIESQLFPSEKGVSIFFRDITAQKTIEMNLRETELNY